MISLDEARIGVLRGGTSNEYHDSLKTGGHVLSDLKGGQVRDVLIDRSGAWYSDGVERRPDTLLHSFDVVVNALHGGMGEDGRLQRLLFHHNIPFTGSGGLASALSLRKPASKKLFIKAGIRTPRYSLFRPQDPQKDAYEFVRTFTLPVMIKPIADGGSHGVRRANSFDDIARIFEEEREEVIVEEFIFGKVVTCGVIEEFRSHDIYPLIPVEIDHANDPFYHHGNREQYGFQCPSFLPHSVKREIQTVAIAAHNALNLAHYSQSDFVVMPSGRVYLLETNALPSLEDNAPFVHALEAIGSDRSLFLKHILELALARR